MEAAPVRSAPLGALDAAAVRRVWDEILTTVRRRSVKAWAVVREAVVRDVHDDEIVLVFQHAVHANMFGAETELLLEALREVLGGTWRVRAELGGDERAGNQPPLPATVVAPSGPAVSTRPTPDSSTETGGWPETARPGAGSAPADAGQAPHGPAPQGQAAQGPATGGTGSGAAGSGEPEHRDNGARAGSSSGGSDQTGGSDPGAGQPQFLDANGKGGARQNRPKPGRRARAERAAV